MSRPRVVIIQIVSLLLLASAALTGGCNASASSADYADNPIAARETLAQVSTLDALTAGTYDGVISSGELKGYGDFGIGTFQALDGEMVMLDRQVYQVKTDGVAYRVPDSLLVPWAAVTFFESDRRVAVASGVDLPQLQTILDNAIPSKNIIIAVKLEGDFSHMKTRSVPKQAKPFPPLAEVTKKQQVFDFTNISGTVIGFRCPQYLDGVNLPGFHFHFLTEDRKAGGHVLEFTVKDAEASLDYTSSFFMVLPELGSDFHKLQFNDEDSNQLEEVE